MTSFTLRKSLLFLMLIAFALLWPSPDLHAAPIVIDDFDVLPIQEVSVACCAGSADSFVDNAGALGGERDIKTTVLSGVFGAQFVFAGPPLNGLYHAQQPFMTGQTVVTWDGNDDDADVLAATGLGGVDFTDGNSNSGFYLHITMANRAADIVLTAYTDANNASSYTLTLTGSVADQGYFIPFSSFTPLINNVDFTNVGAFELLIDGAAAPGLQIQLDTITLSAMDFGDLPTDYGLTTVANDGARHILGDLFLGTAVDGESDGQASANAAGDDNSGLDDEDGVSIAGAWTTGVAGGSISVVASGAGCLSGWIDWDDNATFDDVGDSIIVMTEVTAGSNLLTFDIPLGTTLTDVPFFGRFRLVPDTGTSPDCSDDTPVTLTGEINNGEVEDHVLIASTGLTIDDVTVDESAGNAVFTVSLNSPVNMPVTVEFATSDGTAVQPGDYTATTDTIVIAANTLSNTLAIPINDDNLVESSETFRVTLSNATNANIVDNQGIGTILDNDSGPVAVDDAYNVDEDAVLSVSAPGVLGNDSDADIDPLTAVLNTSPSNGDLSFNMDGSFVYTPTADFNGSDSFTYRANDGVNNSNIATVTITVAPINDPLTAVDDSDSTAEDTTLTIFVLNNDTDVDGDAAVVTVTSPTTGTAVINFNDTIDYTPAAEFSGTDTFDYTISDGVYTDTATVTVTVTAVNDPPTATPDSDTTAEDSSVATDVLSNDSDIDGNIVSSSLNIFLAPNNGSALADAATGVITYTPALNFNGVDSYEYQICDDGSPLPSACATATVVITVTAVNDPPIAVDDQFTSPEDTLAMFDILANDINVDMADTLSVTAVTPTSNGNLSLNPDSTVTYSPTLNFNGTDTFMYTMSDGVFTDTAVVTITVANINDIPVVSISLVTTPTLEGTPISFVATVTDPGRAATSGGDITWDFGDGTIITGTLTPQHAYAENGTYTATVTYVDDQGAMGNDTIVLTIENAPPIVSAGPDQTVVFGAAVSFSGTYTDPGTLDTHLPQWDFGDGDTMFNTLTPDHTYTQPGTYTVTLRVTDDDGGVSEDQLLVHVFQSRVYLPIVLNNPIAAPDLEIEAIAVTADNVTITIANTGNQAVADGFWVDLYINPNPIPTAANQTWDQLSSQGIVWGISDVSALTPGGVITIDLNHSALDGMLTDFSGTFSDGMEIYVQVDSANIIRESGGIMELHELLNMPYNNIEHVTVSLNP